MSLFSLTPTSSIHRRLLQYLSSGLLTLWILTTIMSSISALAEINEIADEQMQQHAYTLRQVFSSLPKEAIFIQKNILSDKFALDNNKDTGFILWNKKGQRLFSDQEGYHIPFKQDINGFSSSGYIWESDSWRYLYIVDDELIIAVSQRLEERFSMLFNALWIQLLLLLISLPILLLLIIYGVNHGLAPLKKLSIELQHRHAHSLDKVSEDMPIEIKPLVQEINHLLERLDQTIQRERQFTSDAAHELRSPLTALKVQTEVLALSDHKEDQLQRIIHIQSSIDRASRLVEQLLILSRLDPLQAIPDAQTIQWEIIIPQLLQSISLNLREKNSKLTLETKGELKEAFPLQGNPLLIQIMIRNLLDNAIRYSPEHSRIILYLDKEKIQVIDEGEGIESAHLPKIKERFYRPAGQAEHGSGLGLSIVQSIAHLHQLVLTIQNRETQGLCVTLSKMVDR
ncbi:ATP-binding protein [Pelistega ratti]|uniref:ATP-binding protein n=1 Tax=Pelistega ratti TaxID=2652177 RepID=UPI00135A9F9E|nr:ATP-binding protein [Pelistega ratti]